MTNEHDDDEAFNAFTSRTNKLSQAIQALPQPAPSAALDQLILKRIEQTLHDESTTSQQPIIKPTLSQRLFISLRTYIPTLKNFWLLPVGAAAGLVISAGIKSYYSTQIEQNNTVAVMATNNTNTQSKQTTKAATTPVDTSKELSKANKKTSSQATAPEITITQEKTSESDTTKLKQEPARQPPLPTNTVGKKITLTQNDLPPVVHVRSLVDSTSNSLITDNIVAERTKELAATSETISPPPAITKAEQKPVLAQDDRFYTLETNLPIAKVAQVASRSAPQAAIVTNTLAPHTDIESKPEQWVSLIDSYFNQGLSDTALKEWRKFRAAYPNYVISPALQEKITTSEMKSK